MQCKLITDLSGKCSTKDVPYITGATIATSHFHGGTNRPCATTDQHKIFPGDRNEFIRTVIFVCGIFLSSLVDLEKETVLLTRSGKGMESYFHRGFLCVWRTVALGGWGEQTAHLPHTEKPRLTPKEWGVPRDTQGLPLRQLFSQYLLW